MKQAIDAINENGAFRPLKRPPITEGQLVRLTVETVGDAEVEDIIAQAAVAYRGLSDTEIAEIEAIDLDRGEFFGNETA